MLDVYISIGNIEDYEVLDFPSIEDITSVELLELDEEAFAEWREEGGEG